MGDGGHLPFPVLRGMRGEAVGICDQYRPRPATGRRPPIGQSAIPPAAVQFGLTFRRAVWDVDDL